MGLSAITRTDVHKATALHPTNADYDFHCVHWARQPAKTGTSDPPDLAVIKRPAASTEVHVLAAPDYQVFSLHSPTGLHPTTVHQFSFGLAHVIGPLLHPQQRRHDLLAIKKNGTDPGKVEVHVFTGESGFSTCTGHAVTALGEVGDEATLAIADWGSEPNCLFQVRAGGPALDLSAYSASSNYSSRILHASLPLFDTLEETWALLGQVVGRERPDLVLVHTRWDEQVATVDVLSGESGFQEFRCLDAEVHLDGPSQQYAFTLGSFDRGGADQLVAIWQQGAPTTEVHTYAIPLHSNAATAGRSLGGLLESGHLALRNAAGLLSVFGIGADSRVWMRHQLDPDTWEDWRPLGGRGDEMVVAANQDGRLEVFLATTGGAVSHCWQTTPGGHDRGWSAWHDLGCTMTRLAVGSNHDGRLELFGRGADGALWHTWQNQPNGGWHAPASLGSAVERLAVARDAGGRLEVFARTPNGRIRRFHQVAPNGGWAPAVGWNREVRELALEQDHAGLLVLFATDREGQLAMTRQPAAGAWASDAWTPLGTDCTGLTVGRDGRSQLHVLGTGSDGALWAAWQRGPAHAWSAWAAWAARATPPAS